MRRLYPDISFFQMKKTKKFKAEEGSSCDIIGRASSKRPQSIDIVRSTFGGTHIKNNRSISNGSGSCDDIMDELLVSDENEEYHWQVVARILFIFAKLNPGQSYVQGMNEIIGPLYYVFTNDSKEDWSSKLLSTLRRLNLKIYSCQVILKRTLSGALLSWWAK